VIICGFADIKREARRKAGREIPISELNKEDARKVRNLSVTEPTVFIAGEYEVPIENDILADALLRLPENQRQIILLGACGESDKRIADRLNVPRSTVQYRRTDALRKMKAYAER
jgi:DNA-directed RNA polymerase specialized sigma24 family protein